MAGTKERIIEASAELFRRNGYTGTGMKQIVAAAAAPFGSLYHFFPGGKEQLGEEVIRTSGEFYMRLVDAIVGTAPDVVTGIESFFVGAAGVLEASDYADACPIATVALEVASTNEPLRIATAEVFESWIAAIADRFRAAGIATDRSRELAIEAIAAIEGAFVLCRAMKSTIPMEIAGRAVATSIRAAMPRRAKARVAAAP